ncbi:MAG: F0F1 ATP synthase subunit B [Rhodobacteraceae bacterium]|nr:F0F1 ATP synthase subunit B [Paracoccaceae bacterium]
MRIYLAPVLAPVLATPAFAAAKGPFFSLANTDFVVLIAFLLFIGVLVYFKVPGMLTGFLDRRAKDIRAELDEARALYKEAHALLLSYEHKRQKVQEQADRIVASARADAATAAEQARADLQKLIERRLAAAEDRIASAQDAAIKDIRDQAISVAVSVAQQVIAKQMTTADSDKLIEAAIAEVGAKLH